jgi:hypothetical protein
MANWKAQCACLLLLFCILAMSSIAALADNNRLELADQFNWWANTGFYLDLENTAYSYGTTQPITALTLDLGVANGSSWRFLTTQPAWQYNHRYQVVCTITGSGATLTLDGRLMASSNGAFAPDQSDQFVANQVPLWACADADYWVCENSVEIKCNGAELLSKQFPSDEVQIKTLMFTPEQAITQNALSFAPGQTVKIAASFTLVQKLNYAPLVDTYGQSRIGTWPNKIASDAQLVAGAKSEMQILDAMPSPQGRDAYGGDKLAGWSAKSTGYFTTTQHNGFWWLISPDGHPCFYTGVDDAIGLGADLATPITGRAQLFESLPSPSGEFAAAYPTSDWGDTSTTYFSYVIADAIKKYGSDWKSKSKSLLRLRLQKWGFTGIGKWSATPGDLPYISNLYYWAPTLYDTKPDIFDPAIVGDIQASIQSQVAVSAKDPYLVGWAVGNEEPDCVAYPTVAAILQLTSATPGKQALVNDALQTFYGGSVAAMATAWGVAASTANDLYTQALAAPAAEQEQLREYYEDNYFRVMYQIVKALDPRHIYFGDWQVPNWNYSINDFLLDAAHCDVVGYDLYSTNFGDANIGQLAQQVGKPILCGEFSYAPTYNGLEAFGQFFTYANYDADAGADYSDWIAAATQNPNCIGGCWFMYRDEPITGRGPGASLALVQGENYAFGTVDTADQPKWDLVNAMTAANMNATQMRLAANTAAGAAKR